MLLKNFELQLNQGEWALLETYRKLATGGMYYQMSTKQRELTVTDVTNSHICSPKSIYFCGILYPSIEILDEIFDSASNLLQDPVSLVQCLGSKEHLAKSKSILTSYITSN